jgi:hypothetical protein
LIEIQILFGILYEKENEYLEPEVLILWILKNIKQMIEVIKLIIL